MREWITDPEKPLGTYLIKFTRDGEPHGWQYADFNGVVDALSDQAYASFIDEEPDGLDVFVLSGLGVIPVRLVSERDDVHGLVVVTGTFREPGKRGKPVWKTLDTSTYRIMGW